MISLRTTCDVATDSDHQRAVLKQVARHVSRFDQKVRPPFNLYNDLFICLMLYVVTLSVYWNSLHGDFVHDDISAIVTNNDVTGSNPLSNLLLNDFWGEPLSSRTSHKSHRPFTTLTFRLNAVIHGLNTFGFHFVNIGLHASVVLVLYCICRQILKWEKSKSIFSALMFAIHPVHTEAVSNIVGRADILATLFFLLSFQSYTRIFRGQSHKYWKIWCITSIVLATMSFLSKEQGISSFLFLVFYDIFCSNRPIRKKESNSLIHVDFVNFLKSRLNKRTTFIITTALLLIVIRIMLMGFQFPIFSQEDNPASHSASLKTRILTFYYLAPLNLWIMLWPVTLSYDWQIGSIPLVTNFMDPRNIGTAILLFFILVYSYKFCSQNMISEKRMLCLGFVLPVLAFLPASNLLFYVGFVLAERILYMPSLGICILVSHGLHKLYYKLTSTNHISQGIWRVTFVAFVSILVLSSFIRTYKRNQAWISRKTLFLSGVQDLPQNAKMHYNYGNMLKDDGDIAGAERHYRIAIKHWPYYASAHNNLATVVKNSTDAIFHFQQAIRYNPGHGRAFYNLAVLQSKRNLTTSAISLLKTAIALDNSLVEAHSKLASIYFNVGEVQQAEIIHKKIVSMRRDDADLANNYGVFLEKTGRSRNAMKYYKKALKYQPGHFYAVINLCRLLENQGRLMEAKDIYESHKIRYGFHAEINDKLGCLLMRLHHFDEANSLYKDLLQKVPNYNRARIHYAQILMEQNHYVKAEDILLSIINTTNSDHSALFHLSSLYKKMNRTTEALEYILSAISTCDVTSDSCANFYVLHGDIMKHLKYFKEAAQSYKMALDLKPNLYHAHVNLGAIYHIQSEFNQAWHHYLAAKVLDPTHPILLDNIAKLEKAQMSSIHCEDSSINSCW